MQPGPKRTKIIAVDFGKVRIGLACSDERKIFASALPNLDAKESLDLTADALLHYLSDLSSKGKFDIEEIVIGLPLHMNGTDSATSSIIRQFADKLRARTSVPVTLWDERLTSVQAERALLSADLSRKKRKTFVDRISAAILLQSYLDSKPPTQVTPV